MTGLNSPEPEIELYESVLDRDQVAILTDYLPNAPGVLIAGKSILRAAGCGPTSVAAGWSELHGSFYRTVDIPLYHELYVRPYGIFWGIERVTAEFYNSDQDYAQCEWALVDALSGMPIWTRSYYDAMRLADYCDPIPQPPVAGSWAIVHPSDDVIVRSGYRLAELAVEAAMPHGIITVAAPLYRASVP